MTDTTNTNTSIAARQAIRAKRMAKAQMVEDVADLKTLLQSARDNGNTVEDAEYMRGLLEAILDATTVEEDGTPSKEALESPVESPAETLTAEDALKANVKTLKAGAAAKSE